MVTRVFEWRREFSSACACVVKAELRLPLEQQSVDDVLAALCRSQDVPDFARDALLADLKKFVEEATETFFNEQAAAAWAAAADLDIQSAVDKICDSHDLVKTYRPLVQSVASVPDDSSKDAEFQRKYIELINSPDAERLLQLESCLAAQVAALLAQSRQAMRSLNERQQRVMEEAVGQSGSKYTDEDINDLNKQHIRNLTSESDRWQSELLMLKDRQLAAFRQAVDSQLDSELLAAQLSTVDLSPSDLRPEVAEDNFDNGVAWEESFTITVGTQLKTAHNLRLLSADLSRLLSHSSRADRLQTALGLYSDSLAAHALMASRDQAFNPPVSADRSVRLKDVCEGSADFHFGDLSRQVERIAERLGGSLKPQVGDVFVTRHSNLNGAHVLFHLITESGDCPELTSQHPVISQGLRRVVRTALTRDINTLTIPLLLTNQLTEEMTIGWCQRRAELVLKTIKGFLVEYITWQSHRLPRCFQFLVPPGLSESMLTSFSSTIQSIFNLSNGLKHL